MHCTFKLQASLPSKVGTAKLKHIKTWDFRGQISKSSVTLASSLATKTLYFVLKKMTIMQKDYSEFL